MDAFEQLIAENEFGASLRSKNKIDINTNFLLLVAILGLIYVGSKK